MADTPTTWDWVWSKRDEIWAAIKELGAWLFGKKQPGTDDRGILILGPAGVGKTTLGKILSGGYDLLFDLPGEYHESMGAEVFPVDGRNGVQIVIPPGQPQRRVAHWPAVLRDLAAGKYRGVLLLGSFGYHNQMVGTLTSYKKHEFYERQAAPRSKQKFLEEVLRFGRDEEIAILEQLAPHLKAAPKKLWFVTVVTKQDLWYPERSDAEAFYRTGDYARIVTDIQNQRGVERFRSELILVSLVISNFTTGAGELLRPNAEGYDHQFHGDSLRRLFETLQSVRDWEQEP